MYNISISALNFLIGELYRDLGRNASQAETSSVYSNVQVIVLTDDLINVTPYSLRSTRLWQRNHNREWLVDIRFLLGGVQVSGVHPYPVGAVCNDYSFDWNRIFARFRFFIPSQFISVDPDSSKFSDISCTALSVSGIFRSCETESNFSRSLPDSIRNQSQSRQTNSKNTA